MEFTLDIYNLIVIALMVFLLYLGYNLLSLKWSYKISKPFNWEEGVKNGSISKSVQKLERTYRDKVRFYQIYFQIERLKREKVIGDFVELGVYKGETARIIHHMDKTRSLHLFDTFSGFDKRDLEKENSNDPKMKGNLFSDAKIKEVKTFINGNENVHFYPGYFPDTAVNIETKSFSFVHLDADLYQPTISALQFFYPRLAPGGVIVIHDFNHNWEGVRKAVLEFSSSISETIVEVPDWQGSVMIIRNKF